MKLIVKKVFRDKFSKAIYKIGDAVEFSDDNRINDLIRRGLCEEIKEDAGSSLTNISVFDGEYERLEIMSALKACDVKVAANISNVKLVEKVNQLDEETIVRLQKALETLNR